MMAAKELLLNNAKNYISGIPKGKLYLYIFLFVSIVGGSIIGLSLLQKENFQPLFSGLAVEDASMIVAKLKEQKVPYKLGLGGTTIYVPKEKVFDLRLLLASQNALPGNSGVGFELFDKTSYGMTEFMQNINYKRAIQGELARTINQMPEVKTSRVHIALPERTLFYDREKEVTASIFLKLKPGKSLPKDQVAGIVQFVAGSIEGLKSENITVIDSSGKILYKSGDSNSPVVLSGQQHELQKNVEKRLEESVQSMLSTFMPASRSIVRANIELNLRKVEIVEEEYDPEKAVVATSKLSKEMVANKSTKVGGVPGVASNGPGAQTKDARMDNQDKSKESERQEEQKTFELSKTMRKIVEPYGDIKRVSLAVVVDGKYEKVKGQKGEESRYVPRSQKELNDIKNLVARTVGYNEERGDKLEVVSAPFETENIADEKGIMDVSNKKEMLYDAVKYVFYLTILLSVFLFVIKPILGILKDRSGTMAMRQVSGVTDSYAGAKSAHVDAMLKEGIDTTPVLSKPQPAFTNALQDKALVKSIIKEWVKEGS